MTDVLDARLCLPPRPLRNPDGLQLPAGACDAHFHVFAANAPLASPRSYTPQLATIDGWLAMADSFGVDRGVLVQPSVYGLDNRVLLTALAAHHDRLRGIVVIPPETDDAELMRLHRLGVRGIRINLRNKSGIGFDALPDLAPRIRDLGWHIQFQVGPDAIDTVTDLTNRYDITGVIDHLAFMPLDQPEPALSDMRRALDSGRVYVKISAPYRLKDRGDAQGYREAVSTLAVCYPNRLMWGSDWPHTELFDTVPHEDTLVLLSLESVPKAHHAAIFADNAANLYWTT